MKIKGIFNLTSNPAEIRMTYLQNRSVVCSFICVCLLYVRQVRLTAYDVARHDPQCQPVVSLCSFKTSSSGTWNVFHVAYWLYDGLNVICDCWGSPHVFPYYNVAQKPLRLENRIVGLHVIMNTHWIIKYMCIVATCRDDICLSWYSRTVLRDHILPS
jgi:hypothetical protein